MGKCILCEKETQNQAVIFTGTPIVPTTDVNKEILYHFESHTDNICSSCVNKKLSRDLSDIWFYLALQLLWMKVAQDRFTSFWSFLAAFLAIISLVRLSMILTRKFLQHFRSDTPIPGFLLGKEDLEQTASLLLMDSLLLEMNRLGKQIKTLREYEKQ